ncbi:MAG: response regulator [Candidatus Dormibacteraceae bacterium]
MRVGSTALFLVVEDNADDVLLLRRAFTKGRWLNPLHIVSRAEEAVEYLTGVGRYADRAGFPMPAVVLLDLKLPGMSGHEFLRWIRSRAEFRALRVVVVSSSDDMRDVNEAFKSGADSYIIKPTDFDAFEQFSLTLGGYWTWLAQAPRTAVTSRSRPKAGALRLSGGDASESILCQDAAPIPPACRTRPASQKTRSSPTLGHVAGPSHEKK